MLRKIIDIGKYTVIANLRNRLFLVLILFGLLVLGSSALLSILGQEQQIRILMDLGLASIEVLTLFTVTFLMVQLILEEIESKTIYLILTRAVPKPIYLIGRLAGTLTSVYLAAIIMLAIHSTLLFIKGWKVADGMNLYYLSFFMSMEKIFLISALALFFSLFSSSGVVSWIFTFFFWVLGHFAMEFKYLIEQIKNPISATVFKAIYLIIPHFQYLNARDLWISVGDRLPSFIVQGSLYTLVYGFLAFSLALYLFKKKEF